jgi:hypothetical protein
VAELESEGNEFSLLARSELGDFTFELLETHGGKVNLRKPGRKRQDTRGDGSNFPDPFPFLPHRLE